VANKGNKKTYTKSLVIKNGAEQQTIYNFIMVCRCNYSTISCTIYELSGVKNIMTLKSTLGVIEGHKK